MEYFDIALDVFELLQNILDVQFNKLNAGPNAGYGADMIGSCDRIDPATGAGEYGGGYCPASAFTAVGAAFSTMGYWVQADLLDRLAFSEMGLWAPLIYIISAIAGMFGVALGQPPRNYIWFFVGPALYAWLIDTRVDVDGVAWRVAAVDIFIHRPIIDTKSQSNRSKWEL